MLSFAHKHKSCKQQKIQKTAYLTKEWIWQGKLWRRLGIAGQESNKSLGNPQCSNTHKPEGKRMLNYVKLSHKKHTI